MPVLTCHLAHEAEPGGGSRITIVAFEVANTASSAGLVITKLDLSHSAPPSPASRSPQQNSVLAAQPTAHLPRLGQNSPVAPHGTGSGMAGLPQMQYRLLQQPLDTWLRSCQFMLKDGCLLFPAFIVSLES